MLLHNVLLKTSDSLALLSTSCAFFSTKTYVYFIIANTGYFARLNFGWSWLERRLQATQVGASQDGHLLGASVRHGGH